MQSCCTPANVFEALGPMSYKNIEKIWRNWRHSQDLSIDTTHDLPPLPLDTSFQKENIFIFAVGICNETLVYIADFMHLFAHAAAGYTIHILGNIKFLFKRTSDHDRKISLSKVILKRIFFIMAFNSFYGMTQSGLYCFQ